MEKEEMLAAFSDGVERFLGDAIQMAVEYGRLEGRFGGDINKILNALGTSGEVGFSFVSVEYALGLLVKAIDEGRLEVRNGLK